MQYYTIWGVISVKSYDEYTFYFCHALILVKLYKIILVCIIIIIIIIKILVRIYSGELKFVL